jgi:DNA mismatch repair protein MutS
MSRLTPLMAQHKRIKSQYPDAILFYRVGDFYETFYEDAQIASKVLEIALTSRDKEADGSSIPMAGVPYHAVDSYLYKMVKAGYKVAICEQVEDPKLAKGVVKREVVRVFTAGTLTDPKVLDGKANNYLAAISKSDEKFGLAHIDLSTGEFFATEIEAKADLLTELFRLLPAECLISENLEDPELIEALETVIKPAINRLVAWRFASERGRSELLRHFQLISLDGFGCENCPQIISAAGAIIQYLNETQKQQLQHILSLKVYSLSSYMVLDADAQRNLELMRSLRDNSTKGTLLEVLDETLTSMAGRKIRSLILQPLIKADEIKARLDAVEELYKKPLLQEELRELLQKMGDLERLMGRIGLGTANARDLLSLKDSLRLIPAIKEKLSNCTSSRLNVLTESLQTPQEVIELIENAIHEAPPLTVKEGGIIKDGYHPEVDELRKITSSGKNWIAQLQKKERERTRISSLKIGYNQVFGYYIEVSKTNLKHVPEDYIRKQTLVNGERFITPELKERESQILNAQERISTLEYEIFSEIRSKVASHTDLIQSLASALAMIDVLSSFAYVAARYNYVKPQVDDSDEVIIKDGRHPVVERFLTKEGFVPNDVRLNGSGRQMYIVTGPNLSGKSTFLRQTALITLMAQIGSFVPAAEAKVGVVDRIFTRVGASDNLVMGQSTFLVEMNETANILNNATRKSLIILDEIGRGTSTFDGLSIAWAVAEYILQNIGAKTLFATHYHELIELEKKYPQAKNYNVAVYDDGQKIAFLRKVVEGGTDQSYGIHVAKLAGLPLEVIERANQILTALERHNLSVETEPSTTTTESAETTVEARHAAPLQSQPSNAAVDAPKPKKRVNRQVFRDDSLQLSLFSYRPDPMVEEIKALELEGMTPIQALNKLYELKAKVLEKGKK